MEGKQSHSGGQAIPDRSVGQVKMPATLWTVILSARDLQSPDAQAALASLCETYWYPLYAFVRRQSHDHHRAQDLTQAFFENLFERDWLQSVDRQKGRFRTFLLCSLSNFLINDHRANQTLKRGGGKQFVSWDADLAESRQRVESAVEANPASEFDRLWSCALVESALADLKAEYARCGKAELFAALAPFMTRVLPAGYYAEVATRLHATEGALRIAMHRLLQRFGELLRSEVANVVADPKDIDDELREVLKAWAGG